MGSLFRLTGDTVTPSAGTRVLKASEAAVLLEANAVLDAARERVADMERKAGEAYERRREEGYRDGGEEGRLEHAEKVMETVLSSVEYIEGIEATLVNVVAVAVRKVIGEIDENERIVRIVRNALVTVRNQQHVTIRVAPADEKAVREQLQILDPDRIILDQPGILGGAALWHDHQPAARLPDRLHLAAFDHPDKLVVADLLALALFQGRVHHADHRQRDAQDDHHDPDPRASRLLSIISVLIVVIHSVFLHFFYTISSGHGTPPGDQEPEFLRRTQEPGGQSYRKTIVPHGIAILRPL